MARKTQGDELSHRGRSPRGTESLQTLCWRDVDSNFPFRAVSEHRTAPDRSSALSLICSPSDGFETSVRHRIAPSGGTRRFHGET